jgi:hypothetical protein
MVLWAFPDCHHLHNRRRFNFYRHLQISLLLILALGTSHLIGQPSSQSHSHFTTHTISTKYGSLRGIRLQFSSSAARHLGKKSFAIFRYSFPTFSKSITIKHIQGDRWNTSLPFVMMMRESCSFVCSAL